MRRHPTMRECYAAEDRLRPKFPIGVIVTCGLQVIVLRSPRFCAAQVLKNVGKLFPKALYGKPKISFRGQGTEHAEVIFAIPNHPSLKASDLKGIQNALIVA